MGIPKFFRYIAQRWPLCSQLVNDNVIPEFDNMYLDMNSIVHMCTHANAENVGHLDEDMVFQNIGNYIEHLFSVISPKKVFFMAIDGVAPRAKMNQQRGRRFRSAKDAEDKRREAAEKGIELDDDPFDSNCITPGTVFMANLTRFLKYFIARKITEDSKWQECKIVLSGHEVPGEGEHKIMNYIRELRSGSEFDPNTRHCLYGLDADLIMLGLSTHEPHFSLLREEVTFGRKLQFQSAELSEKRFNLLHLSLAREYIELELTSGPWDTPPNFERQLDDFILIMFFIGNDFLPELPMLMINEGAIPVIFDTYKEYLRSSNNEYLSENGRIKFAALKNWMNLLKSYQTRKFEEHASIGNWFADQMNSTTSTSGGDEDIVLTQAHRDAFDYVKKFMRNALKKEDANAELEVTEEPNFIALLAEQTGFSYVDGKLKCKVGSMPTKEALRVLRIYDVSKTSNPHFKEQYDEKFTEWKNRYYLRKFHDTYDSEKIRHAALRYLEGLQWVLFYYYRSCPSWSWYYDEHYAPLTTELISAIGDDEFEPEFQLGEPFRPFEQLMAVLPDRSAPLLPQVFHHLMHEETSPIKDFYPATFELDRNGKKAEWESIVLIPFIDESRLLKYVRPIEDSQLTEQETIRNARGQTIEFLHDPSQLSFYQSPSARMPSIEACSCVMRYVEQGSKKIKYGRLEGSSSGLGALAGFPSMKTLPFTWELDSGTGVKVFEMPSRDDSVIIHIQPASHKIKIGEQVYINWPFLSEARVTSVRPRNDSFVWTKVLPDVLHEYKRLGVDIGETEAQIGVRQIQGLKREENGSYVKDFDGPELFIPAQLLVHEVKNEDPRFVERGVASLKEEFPLDSHVLLLLAKYYGFPASIKAHNGAHSVDVEVTVPRYRDPVFSIGQRVAAEDARRLRWFSLAEVSRSLELPVKSIIILTSRLPVESNGRSANVALQLRHQGLSLKAEGYTRMGYNRSWEFSDRGVAILVAYLSKFKSALTAALKGKKDLDSNTVKEMKDWVAKHTEKIAFIPTQTTQLSSQSVQFLEEKVQSLPPAHLERVIIKSVERGALLSPSDAQHQLRSQSFRLGDRVVSALDHGKVPLYSRGVVVGINGGSSASTTLDIVWDFEFGSASKLDGKLKSNRGLTVPASSVLNFSKAQLEYVHSRHHEVQRVPAKTDTRNIVHSSFSSSGRQTAKPNLVPSTSTHNDWQAAKAARGLSNLSLEQRHANVPQSFPSGFPGPQMVAPAATPATAAAAAVSAPPPPSSTSSENGSGPAIPTGPSSTSTRTRGKRRSHKPELNPGADTSQQDDSSAQPHGRKKQGNKASHDKRAQNARSTSKHEPKSRGTSHSELPKDKQNAKPLSTGGDASAELPRVAAHSSRPHDPVATKKLLSTLFNKPE